MVIVFVIDNYGEFSNGTTISALRTKMELEARGHTVRVVSAGPVRGEEYYSLNRRFIPIVSWASRRQHMYFARPDKRILRRAFTNADIVHFFLPFRLSLQGVRIAKKMRIPVTAAFHTQPENITYGAGLGRLGRPIAWMLYQSFKNDFYRHVSRIHCPSTFLASELRRNGYSQSLHVISNGVGDMYRPSIKASEPSQSFTIVSIGRYAAEKNQETIISAVGRSKYRERIHLILAGFGPREKRLKKWAKKHRVRTTFRFFSQSELLEVLQTSDLYVHAAVAEIEGIACLEAIACGLVPIIAQSKKSAASQFALDEKSTFHARDASDLALRIDYWLTHDKARMDQSIAYQQSMEKYRISHSIDLFEEMLNQAVEDHQRSLLAQTKALKKVRKRITFPVYKRMLSFVFYYLIAFPLLWIYVTFLLGVRFRHRKYLRDIKGGAVLVSNHVHTLDSAMNGVAAFPKKPIFTGLKANFRLPLAGFLVNILGTVPVPETRSESRVFLNELTRHARSGRFVHFFPEGHLIPYDTELRPFKKGAFQVAEEADVPIVPIGIAFKEKTSIFPLLAKQKVVLSVGKPIYPDSFRLKREQIAYLQDASFGAMQSLIKLH
jgi:1-acyl-sn-glycerol-3-phosphate acyltransferase